MISTEGQAMILMEGQAMDIQPQWTQAQSDMEDLFRSTQMHTG